MESYLGVARKKGITDDEIGAVQAIVMMAVQAGRVRAQFREVREGMAGGDAAEAAKTGD